LTAGGGPPAKVWTEVSNSSILTGIILDIRQDFKLDLILWKDLSVGKHPTDMRIRIVNVRNLYSSHLLKEQN
jgi:hypothetical protein